MLIGYIRKELSESCVDFERWGRMPRPGPRPYECVRRAWHSDRHQSMRGSIIQQIFKVVYENHNSVTKKNKEWQEKLPVVVLKAEEIMYSKANSEAEYMDLGTLWDRVNDAIDTIIRKDETAETGGLLPPCVEAALTLGCVPVRASRSQRHSNPRNYLSPRTQEPASTTSKASPGSRSDTSSSLWSTRSGNQPNLQRVPLVSGSNSQVMPDINLPPSPSLDKTFSPAQNHIAHPSNTPSVGSVYPLYYGTNFQTKVSGLDFQAPQSHSDIIIGTPVYAPVGKPSEIICSRSMWRSDANETGLNRTNHGGFEENITEKVGPECDLSLRLGPFSDSYHTSQGSAHGSEGGNPRFSEGDKTRQGILSTSSQASEFCLLSVESPNDPSRLRLAGHNLGDEDQSAEESSRKRKLQFNGNVSSGKSFWRL